MSATLKRALSSLMNKVAAVSSFDALPEVENLHSEDVDADDIAPDDSASCIDCDDAWLALVVDDIRPEDSISNVCVDDPDHCACDAGEHRLSKKSDSNDVDESKVSQSNKDSSAHDEASVDTWKRSSRRHVSLRARIGHPDREQHVLDGDGHKAGFKDLKSSCDASVKVDADDSARDPDLDADYESTEKRDVTLKSDRNCVEDLSLDGNGHFDALVHLESQPASSVFVVDKSARGDFSHKISAKLDAREKLEEVSYGITTIASSECDEVLDADDN
eukprot:TRINITY_DN5153_c0_g3_i1.p1 TRINITY_DN5153_c0_g3~~TRINITY_DN5153_c0_g3_i1.p1  ORF type:complete len:275 (-),score=52.08 TRINITY_DN5153_c0_g3_i1:183-1007(-)